MSALPGAAPQGSGENGEAIVAYEGQISRPGLDVLLFRRTVLSPMPSLHWNSDHHNLFMALNGPVAGNVHLRRQGVARLQQIGELFFLPAGIPFHFTGERGACTRTVLLRFNTEFLDSMHLGGWRVDNPARCFNIRNPQLRSAMFRIAQELVMPGFASQALVEGLAATACVDAMRHFDDSASPGNQPLAASRLRRITSYLEESGAPTPSLAELAALCGISPTHLSRAFRKATGMTIYRYIEEIRLRNAQTLLATTDLKLKEIAFQLGFSRPSGFSVAFRRASGESPIAYRQRMRGKV